MWAHLYMGGERATELTFCSMRLLCGIWGPLAAMRVWELGSFGWFLLSRQPVNSVSLVEE